MTSTPTIAAERLRRLRHGGLPRPRRVARRAAESTRQQRNRRDVLEQQHRERAAPHRRGEQVALVHRLHRDRGRRQREREPGDDRRLPAAGPQREAARGEHGAAQRELQRAAAEHRAAHRPEPLRLELEPDDEQHQHDAELGEVQDRLDVVARAAGPTARSRTPAIR